MPQLVLISFGKLVDSTPQNLRRWCIHYMSCSAEEEGRWHNIPALWCLSGTRACRQDNWSPGVDEVHMVPWWCPKKSIFGARLRVGKVQKKFFVKENVIFGDLCVVSLLWCDGTSDSVHRHNVWLPGPSHPIFIHLIKMEPLRKRAEASKW